MYVCVRWGGRWDHQDMIKYVRGEAKYTPVRSYFSGIMWFASWRVPFCVGQGVWCSIESFIYFGSILLLYNHNFQQMVDLSKGSVGYTRTEVVGHGIHWLLSKLSKNFPFVF